VKILCVFSGPGNVRNFESVIRVLAARSHSLHLVFCGLDKHLKENIGEIMQEKLLQLSREYPSVTFDLSCPVPKRKKIDLFWSRKIRAFADYLRYLRPEYEFAKSLRVRVRSKNFALFSAVADLEYALTADVVCMRMWYAVLERLLSVPSSVVEYIAAGSYDAVFVTPLVDIGSEQVDWVKACRIVGVPSLLGVHSWDNLTNKGVMRVVPDKVFVWNEFQVGEALSMHGAMRDAMVATGAQCYDHWFDRTPSLDLFSFATAIGLKGPAPYLLYLCSSPFIAPEEVSFVKAWVAAVRTHPDRTFATLPIVIRPHPQNAKQWMGVTFEEVDVVVYPREGANPVQESAKQDYFHTLYYACAMTGINTSAMIEASILKKPVFTIVDPKFRHSQEETYHFRYLKDIGPVYSADGIFAHIAQLHDVVADPSEATRKAEKFIAEFIRPRGIDVRATDVFAEEFVKTVEEYGIKKVG